MYLHLGNEYSVKISSILGIFDIENTTTHKSTKEYLEKKEKEKCCVYTTYEMPKSFVISIEKGREVVYISQLAASTLRKRLNERNDY